MQEQRRGKGEAEETEDDASSADAVRVKKPWRRLLLDGVFPQLSVHRGRSSVILLALYTSHVCSAWGDRMWQFLVTLLLATLYPGSLLLPGVFGLVLGLLAALLGTMLGDWVDRSPRMRVVWISLLVQNGLVCLCAIGLALLFGLNLGFCDGVPLYLFIILSALVIILGATANLATVANTISIEKDWVVVIANKNKDTLATLNANMRRIDLVCKLLAPAVAGVILQFTGPLTTTIIVALWNVVSFFAELGLVWLVYHRVPALAVKRFRKPSTFSVDERRWSSDRSEEETGVKEEKSSEGSEGGELGEGGKLQFEDDDEQADEDEEEELFSDTCSSSPTRKNSDQSNSAPPLPSYCACLFTPLISLRDGWTIYIHQQIALAGFAMATIYLTVLGFSGVTATYFLTQGLPNAAIGAAQGIGAIFGVSGTIAYPFIRARIGTLRTGMFGILCQLSMLLLCAIAVIIPAQRVSNESNKYFSAHCPSDNGMSNNSIPICDFPTISATMTSFPMPTTSTLFSPPPTHTVFTPSQALPTLTPTPTPTPMFPSFTPSPTTPAAGSGSGDTLNRLYREADTGNDELLTSSTPYPTCTTSTPSHESQVTWNVDRVIPLVLMLGGVILARFGLWIFDLAVQQLVQETVAEEERGVVGGVMNAMNSIMDMLHYVMVIVAPRPQQFGILTLISVGIVALGALLYAIYLRRVRGHFFHFQQYYQFCKKRCVSKANGHAYRQAKVEDTDQNYLVNENSEEV